MAYDPPPPPPVLRRQNAYIIVNDYIDYIVNDYINYIVFRKRHKPESACDNRRKPESRK